MSEETPKVSEEQAAANLAKTKAETEQIQASTRKAEAEAEIARWKALVPDFSAVKPGAITAPADKAQFGTALGYKAMQAAATDLVSKLKDTLGVRHRVLITSDIDLASDGAAYLEVEAAIEAVRKHADDILKLPTTTPLKPAAGDTNHSEPTDDIETAAVPAVLPALIGALPGLLSLLSVQRNISFAASEKNDPAAAALVAGELLADGNSGEDKVYIHDDFRLPQKGPIYEKLAALASTRAELLKEKQVLALIAKPSAGEKAKLATVTAAIEAIDALETNLRSAPAGARRSPLANAALYQGLFGETKTLTHVLLVKSEGGQVQQVIESRVGPDRVTVIAESAITYMLFDVATERLSAAGSVSGTAQAYGRIGEELVIK